MLLIDMGWPAVHATVVMSTFNTATADGRLPGLLPVAIKLKVRRQADPLPLRDSPDDGRLSSLQQASGKIEHSSQI